MRYYIETYTEYEQDYFQIIPTTRDFEEFLTYKFEQFPQYIAPVAYKKWIGTKVNPEIVTRRLVNAEKMSLNTPIEIHYHDISSNKEKNAYRDELLTLLTEWLSDYTSEFQTHWKSLLAST